MRQDLFTILGAGGNIGHALSVSLRSAGHDVLPIDRAGLPALLSSGRACGHVIDCIGLTGDFRTRRLDTAHAHVTVSAQCLQSLDFESFLYLSSTRVYARAADTDEDAALPCRPGDPSDLYNLTKLAGEAVCLSDPRSMVRVARLSNVFGPAPAPDTFLGQVLAEGAATGRVLFRQAAGSEKDYISLDSVIRLLPAITRSGARRLYNVASGINTSHGTIADLLSKYRGWHTAFAPDAPVVRFPTIQTSLLTAEFGDLGGDGAASLRAMLAQRTDDPAAGQATG
jgi:nucleoside-diphosphate-sugar epimerase